MICFVMMCLCGCDIFDSILGESIGKHCPMLVLEKINTNKDNPENDVIRNEIWTIYYDGAIDYIANYSKSGQQDAKSWSISHGEVEEINKALYNRKDIKDSNELTKHQSHWKFTYTDENGTIISSYTISHNTDKSLREIIKKITEQ